MATRGFRRHSITPVCKLPSLSSSLPLFYTILSIKKSPGSFSLASWGSPFWDCQITEVTGCCFSPSAILWEWGMPYQGSGVKYVSSHRAVRICSCPCRMRESHGKVPLVTGTKEPALLLHWREYTWVPRALRWSGGQLSVCTSGYISTVEASDVLRAGISSGYDAQFIRSSVISSGISSDFIIRPSILQTAWELSIKLLGR